MEIIQSTIIINMDDCQNFTQYKDEIDSSGCWNDEQFYKDLKAIQPGYNQDDFNAREWYSTINQGLKGYS